MPRNTREWCKRKLKICQGHIDNIGMQLTEIEVVYENHHPDISDSIVQVKQVLLAIFDAIEKIDNRI